MFLAVMSVAAFVSSVPAAAAATIRSFDGAAFAEAQRQGRPIVVDVYADWCPTCKAQAPIVDHLARLDRHKDMIIFRLNFDTQETAWRVLNVRRQSTLIAYHGIKETGRSVGDTNPQTLAALLASTRR